MTRDFRDQIYASNRRPQNFVEGVYAGDNFLLSAFGQFNPNDFDLVQERLPELRLDVLPIPILATGAYQRGSVAYSRLREDYEDIVPAFTETSESDRIDVNYRIERPVALTDWLTWTPLAGARVTHYENQQSEYSYNGPDLSTTTAVRDANFTRELYEFGFDLEARAHAVYPTLNHTWDIDGLRHTVRPVLRYRYTSAPDDDGAIAAIDRRAFDSNRPLLDLNEMRHTDQIAEQHLVRLGVENLFQTRASGENAYGSRNWRPSISIRTSSWKKVRDWPTAIRIKTPSTRAGLSLYSNRPLAEVRHRQPPAHRKPDAGGAAYPHPPDQWRDLGDRPLLRSAQRYDRPIPNGLHVPPE